jgi:hypothetical protein
LMILLVFPSAPGTFPEDSLSMALDSASIEGSRSSSVF